MRTYELANISSPGDIGIIFLVVLLLFGSSQIPKLARSIGQAQRELKKAQREGDEPAEGAPEEPSGK